MNVRLAIVAAAAALTSLPVHAQSPAKPDLAKAQATATTVCAACHAPDGNSIIGANPVLAGQGYDYLLRQLRGFKLEKGKEGARPNAVMTAMVAPLSDADLQGLAAYFSDQKPKGLAARDKALVSIGEKIYRGGIADRGVAACAGCHGPAGAGVPSQYPRISGQQAEYTEAQLKAFRAEERDNDPNRMMRGVAARMTDREIKAVADYVAGLR